MPGLLWVLIGIILLLLSFVLISSVIMPSLTILSTNSSLSIKRGDESERKCKSLNLLCIGDGDTCSQDDEIDKEHNKVELDRVESNRLGSDKVEQSNKLNKVTLSRVESNDVELYQAELRPPEVNTDVVDSGLLHVTEAATFEKETSSTENVNTLTTVDNNVDLCTDSIAIAMRKPSNSNIDFDVQCQSISDLNENVELKIARLETLPICSNDFNGIKVAKVIRTQNLFATNSLNEREVTQKNESHVHSPGNLLPEGTKRENTNLLQVNSSLGSSDLSDGDNLVPNFIIGDKLYNYDLSSHIEASVPLVASVRPDAMLETGSTDAEEEIPYMDVNELKRKKRRKRNKCMEIFNVPIEILNRIEEEAPRDDGLIKNETVSLANGHNTIGEKSLGLNKLERIEESSLGAEKSPRIEQDLLGCNKQSHDLGALKISEHVPRSELHSVDSNGQVLGGSNFKPDHSVGPNSRDLSFSWVFNHQLTSVQATSQSLDVYIVSSPVDELENTPSQTFDSFNKPVKRETCDLNKSSDNKQNILSNLNKTCEYNELNNLVTYKEEAEPEYKIKEDKPSHVFQKRNKMVDIKSKLKKVKVGKPIMVNDKITREKIERDDIKAVIIDRKIENDSSTTNNVDTLHFWGLAPIPESCFKSTHSLFSDSPVIDKCCSSESHENCSLISNLEVAERSNAEAPTHFTINESEMPSPSFTFNETFDFNLEPSESLPNAQFSPAYFSGNNQMMNPAHSLKSISDLDFLIGSIPGESKQTTHETYNPPPNSLSCSFSANNDLTNSDADSDVTISGNFEENALRSLDELCIKSLESIKSEPVSLSSMKSKRVTFLENDVSKENLLADSEYPIEKMVDSIVTDLDDEFDKESDTLVEDDVLSLSSSTSSLTSSSSESSGQSMIFNGVPASADSSANQEKPEEILKMDPAVLKHTSIAHALNQHSFHTYLSPIRELSLEISADESDFTNEEETEKEGKILPLKNKDCKTNSVERSLNTLDPELDECVTSFSTFENIVDSCEEDVCLLPRVEEVEMMSSETELDSEVNSSYPTKTITVELEPSEKSTYMCTHFESCHSSDCNSITPSSSDRKSDKMCRKMSSNFNNSEENSEIPIEPVVLNTKFHMAHLTNKANLTDDLSRVAKPNSTSESDELERCSDRPKTNSSGSDLSSELEHILSSIDYESSHSELSPRKYSPSNCSSQSNGSNKNGGGSNSSDNQSDYQDKRFSPSREQVCRMDSTGSDCSARSSGSTDGDSQDRFESRYTGQRGSSSKPGGNTLEKRKPPRSSYLPLKKYELVVVPQKVTLETLSDEKESSSRYRQMVIEKIKNFENINTAQPEPFQSPREIKVSKLREPIIKSNLFDKELNSTLIKDSHLFNSSNSIVNTRKENRTLKKIIQVPNVSDKVKCFEKRILERENSKSPSPEPVDSKNIFSEKISSFENLAKTSNTVSSLKNSPNIDVRVNVSEKLQSFENLKSKGGVSSKSPDFTVAKVEDTSKITSDKINTCNLKTPMKSIRSSYEEKLRNCQLFSSGSLKEHSKSPSKPQFDVLNRISNFESQIRTESETPKKSDGSATGLSKIPKMKTKSLECIFTSQQPKLAKPSERSVSVENISGKDSNVKAKTGSTTQFVNTSSRSLDHDPLSTRTVKNSPSPVSLPAGNLNSSSNKKGIVGQISNSKIPTEGLLNKGGHVNFSKPTQVKALKPQTNVITYPNIQTKPQISHSDSSTTNVEYGELPDIISRDKKDKQFLKDVLNDSGITEDFEDGLKINLSLNDVIVSQDRDVMEMMASIEAVERLSTASPQDRKHLDQKLKLDQPLGSDEPDMCHRTSNDDIFFRSHVLPQLEAERDKKLSSRVIAFQAQCRGYLARKHLAKLKVQDVAVRCIQRNVRKSLQVRDWSWWRLYLKIHPILNVHRTDQELKAKTEELEALKSKLEKLEVERNILKQDNTRLESKLGEITEDYADEHSTATLATERLHIESAERARLERELAEAQSANKRLAETSDKLEAEMQCLRSTDALSLEAEEESGGGSEGDVVYRKKWERAMRELELAKHRLSTQHQDDLEQMVGLRKQLEKKIADAHEQTEEQRQVAAEWKRKQTRLSSELADTRLLLEEQSSRNNLLEKKQRKFDAEFSLLQDELRQERNLKEKAMRDKELALGDKYTMEQSMSSLKLELELKDTKLAGLASELEELQFSSNTEEEVAALKKKKHALEARLKDQEEELDELAGQVQMLEQAKLKVEMSLEQMRKAHRKELSCKDEELEALRCSTQKKVKALQSQLESEHDSRSSLLRERHEMERRLSALADQGVATQAADAETMQRLKRDLKRTKALLKDTQTMLAQARQDNPNRLLLRQLRNQLEDAELARSVATKARLSLESDLADLTLSLEETSRAKGELEARLSEALRERSSLQSTLDENEEEMTEVLKKYQASVAQLSSEQAQLQEAATRVAELETDNAALKEQLADLSGRLESIEAHGDPSSTLALKRLMLKGKELESKLEFEHTTRSRLEVQISRLKETSDKLQAECNLLRGKDNSHSQEARRLQRSIRELKETVQGLEARGVNEALKRKELEKEVQCREAEIASLKNELSVSSQRIQDLQHAIQGDLDDEYDDEDDSDASSDQDQDISSDDEDYTSHQEDEVYTSKDTLRSCSDAGR